MTLQQTRRPESILAFRFRRIETVSTGVRRIVRERMDVAIEQLQRTGDERHEGVHQARKRFKEIRAVLRLVRYELGDRFTVENRWYRDTARALAEARDAQAAIETWDKLLARFPDELESRRAAPIRGRLEQRLHRIATEGGAGDAPPTGILDGLAAARERVGRWPLPSAGFSAMRAGVARSYAQGRRKLGEAYASGTDESFHEWRKRVKDLWYHTTLLRPVWDEVMKARKSRLKALSDALGDDHDLVVLRQLMRDEQRLFGSGWLRGHLATLIATRQQELRVEAHDLGALLYADKPAAYVRRIEAYWRVWRPETKL